MGVLAWLLSNKILCFFVVATAALCASTIVLGVQNSKLREEIDELKNNDDLTTTEPGETTEAPDEDMSDYSLPTNVIPNDYDIYLYPDLDTGLFNGRVVITVEVSEATETVKIHSNTLTIESVTINSNPASFELDSVHELILITVENGPLSTGEATIDINYSGDMKDRIVGLYRSSYKNEDGQDIYIATSKFEPTYARQAYPCFDEPNMKATFTVHLRRPKENNYIGLSNMPVDFETEEEDGQNVMVHFEKSVNMSTYLTCFIVSDFQFTEDTIGEGEDSIPFRVYATPDQVAKTEYARTIGKGVIEYFIDYFQIKFPLPKLDMAAIPDFVSGAMEHWGLVTFRETSLLYSADASSSRDKQNIARVVSHELAHSWFGNLVTMNWWDDLWLNEGFATYIQYKGVHEVEPDWQMMDQFLIDTLHSVLILDATLGSHPIVQTVFTPDQITEIFDAISYNKGGAVLRMLEDALEEEYFREGVTKYLNDHKWSNAVTQDLWNALQEKTDKAISITEFMNTWTQQMGYPVIDVVSKNDNTYILTQRRYLTNKEAVDTTVTPYNYRWTIPVTYITSDEKDSPKYIWFNYTDSEVEIEKPSSASWIKFNYNQIGYYRVKYEDTEWNNLIENIESLSVSDRTHLIEETFRLAESGDISYEIPLKLTIALKNEVEYIPWVALSTMLQEIEVYLSNSEFYSEFQNIVLDTLQVAYDSLTWTENENDSHLKLRARVTVLSLACRMGHEGCLTHVKTLFTTWLETGEPLSQDLRAIIYNYGVSTSTACEWQQLYELFESETDASEKLKLMNGLTHIKDTPLLTRLIEIASTDGVVRSQDYFTLLQYIAANPIGAPIVWDYVRENWPALVERFTLNDRYLGRLIPSITSRFNTATKLEEMQHFFAKYPEAGAGAASRTQALETVGNNIKWLAKNKETVEAWIENYTNS